MCWYQEEQLTKLREGKAAEESKVLPTLLRTLLRTRYQKSEYWRCYRAARSALSPCTERRVACIWFRGVPGQAARRQARRCRSASICAVAVAIYASSVAIYASNAAVCAVIAAVYDSKASTCPGVSAIHAGGAAILVRNAAVHAGFAAICACGAAMFGGSPLRSAAGVRR
eukprot:3941563-Rhodomonas_salina.2